MHSQSLRLRIGRGLCKQAERETVRIADAAELHRLIAVASHGGAADDYTGKRTGTRFGVIMRLEATTDLLDPTVTWSAQMHNISETGFSFWSKRSMRYGSSVFVREFTPKGTRGWLPGRVTHCTVGIRGCLIGARIDRDAMSQ